MIEPLSFRLAHSQQKPRMLSTTRAQSSILAYQRKRVQTRNQPHRRYAQPIKKYKVKAQDFGQIFQASQRLFRQSLAFKFPSELTPTPHRGYLNSLWRTQLKKQDYENAKCESIKKKRYVSSYLVPRKVQSFRLEP